MNATNLHLFVLVVPLLSALAGEGGHMHLVLSQPATRKVDIHSKLPLPQLEVALCQRLKKL